MRRRFALICLVAIAILAVHIADQAHRFKTQLFAASAASPLVSDIQTININGVARSYAVHVPPTYSGDKPLPLVLVLPPMGGTIQMVKRLFGWDRESDQHSFIVVYAQALGEPPAWNVGYMRRYSQYDDMSFLSVLLKQAQSSYKVDPSRIYVTGMSSGAMMTFRVGAQMSDIFAAIGPVSGSDGHQFAAAPMTPYVPTRPVAIIAIHGTADRLVPYSGGWAVPAPTYIADWAKADGCGMAPSTKPTANSSISATSYSDSDGKPGAILYTVKGGGHDYPLWATDTIWKFFEEHPKSAGGEK